MVFPYVSVYLDPPNWNQHHQLTLEQQQGEQAHDAAAALVRPVPMPAERSRPAKIPQPAGPALNCPRCDSTNTKFCYYNNYSLSQPRYFCKTCRRYWTRGGALRSVPVGGGCRRNKRTKSSGAAGGSSSKSSTATDLQASTASSFSSTATSTAIGSAITSSIPLQLPFISSWNSLPDQLPNLGLGFTNGIHQIGAEDHYSQVSSNSCSVGMESLRLHHQIQQFPFALDPPQPAQQPSSDILVGEGRSAINYHGGGRYDLLGQIQAKLSSSGQYLGLPRVDNLWAGSGSSSGLLGDGSFRF